MAGSLYLYAAITIDYNSPTNDGYTDSILMKNLFEINC